MIKSMTGFGRGEACSGPFQATVEVRSVNHRFADVRIKLPPELAGLEHALHQRIQEVVRRGRLEITVNATRSDDAAPSFEINRPLVASYLRAAEQLRGEFQLSGDVTVEAVLAMPEALRARGPSGDAGRPSRIDEAEQEAVLAAFDKALRAQQAMSLQEGEILGRDLARRVATIQKLSERIRKRAPRMIPLYTRRLKARIKELNGAPAGSPGRLDPARLAQEVALLAERSDITEELVRLAGYLEQIGGLLAGAREPIGKKLDFIMQEMNREANTINSKAIDLAICQDAIDVKAEVEKIREQVQNIE